MNGIWLLATIWVYKWSIEEIPVLFPTGKEEVHFKFYSSGLNKHKKPLRSLQTISKIVEYSLQYNTKYKDGLFTSFLAVKHYFFNYKIVQCPLLGNIFRSFEQLQDPTFENLQMGFRFRFRSRPEVRIYNRDGIHKAKSNSCWNWYAQSPLKTIDLGPWSVNRVKERKKSNTLNLLNLRNL
jgi:hypothetical protein